MKKKPAFLLAGILAAGLLYWGAPQVASALSDEAPAAKTCDVSKCPMSEKGDS